MLQQLRFLLKSSMDGLHHVAEVVAAIRIAVFYALLIPINIAIPVHQRIIDLQKLIQLSLAVFKGWVMGQDNENQGTLVLGTAAAHHGEGCGRSHGNKLLVTVIFPRGLIDTEMLHGKPALGEFQTVLIGDAKFPTVLICDVDIGADIDHLEVVIPFLVPF